MNIFRMNHAVLYVRNAHRTAEFYQQVLGFQRVIDDADGRFVFMRAPGSSNHHDIAFFTVGESAGPPTGTRNVGLYHLAWEVPTIDDLIHARKKLIEAGAHVGESDHGANKSVYAKDPDGLEFEVMWLVPGEHWGEEEHQAIIRPLDLEAERARFRALTT